MMSLFSNVRFYILLFSSFLAVAIYNWVKFTMPSDDLGITKLTQLYGLTSIIYLYLALLATPLIKLFPALPFNQKYLKARRAIGVSAFFFAILHFRLAFFWEIKGFQGLAFLENKSLFAIGLGGIALFILFLMTITSFDYVIAKLTFPRWKKLHKLVYVATFFVLIHVLMFGTHFQNFSTIIPKIFFTALVILLILEATRFINFLRNKYKNK